MLQVTPTNSESNYSHQNLAIYREALADQPNSAVRVLGDHYETGETGGPPPIEAVATHTIRTAMGDSSKILSLALQGRQDLQESAVLANVAARDCLKTTVRRPRTRIVTGHEGQL